MSAVAALLVSTNSRPKAAGSNLPIFCPLDDVSTHSRPKAAGRKIISLCVIIAVSTHSRPKAAVQRFCLSVKDVLFQLTAARRRLGGLLSYDGSSAVFQLTAARRRLGLLSVYARYASAFQLTAARRRLAGMLAKQVNVIRVSTHSRPKAAGLML